LENLPKIDISAKDNDDGEYLAYLSNDLLIEDDEGFKCFKALYNGSVKRILGRNYLIALAPK
jgi:hypothetical protein